MTPFETRPRMHPRSSQVGAPRRRIGAERSKPKVTNMVGSAIWAQLSALWPSRIMLARLQSRKPSDMLPSSVVLLKLHAASASTKNYNSSTTVVTRPVKPLGMLAAIPRLSNMLLLRLVPCSAPL